MTNAHDKDKIKKEYKILGLKYHPDKIRNINMSDEERKGLENKFKCVDEIWKLYSKTNIDGFEIGDDFKIDIDIGVILNKLEFDGMDLTGADKGKIAAIKRELNNYIEKLSDKEKTNFPQKAITILNNSFIEKKDITRYQGSTRGEYKAIDANDNVQIKTYLLFVIGKVEDMYVKHFESYPLNDKINCEDDKDIKNFYENIENSIKYLGEESNKYTFTQVVEDEIAFGIKTKGEETNTEATEANNKTEATEANNKTEATEANNKTGGTKTWKDYLDPAQKTKIESGKDSVKNVSNEKILEGIDFSHIQGKIGCSGEIMNYTVDTIANHAEQLSPEHVEKIAYGHHVVYHVDNHNAAEIEDAYLCIDLGICQ
jgi:hypothetical protein